MVHAKLAFVVGSFLVMPFLSPAQDVLPPQAAPAAAAPTPVPQLVPYSGVALDAQGRSLGTAISVSFRIFRDQLGGEPLWSEAQTVLLDAQGRFKAELGATLADGIPPAVFATGDARWLEVQIAGQNSQPRILLASVPYALKAGDAATLSGFPASAFALAGSVAAPAAAVSAGPDGTTGAQTVTTTGGVSGYLPIFSGASTVVSSNLFQDSTGIGVNTKAPAAMLDVHGTSVFRGNLQMAITGNPTATAGTDSNTLTFVAGVWKSTKGTIVTPKFVWQAIPIGNNTPNPSAGLQLLSSTTGALVPTGFSFNANGTVNFATGQSFPGAGSVSSVATGAGLTGGPITQTGTVSIANAGVTNAMLQNPSVTVSAGTGLTGGGAASLGGSTSLALNPNISGSSASFSSTSRPVVFATNTEVADYGELGAIDSSGFEYGVYGDGGTYGTGVGGNGPSAGVYGNLNSSNSTYAFGYLGTTVNDYTAGVYSAATTYGVFASASTYGVAGESGYTGVYGSGPTYGVFSDGPTGSSKYSSTVIALPDNRVVETYAVSSPENWLEDFGTGQLRNGSVTIALDPTFAEAVSEDAGYHVFLTPNGDCDGLYVTAKTAAGFEVRELHGGHSSVAFDYRIVARRRGLEGLRMEQLDADAETAETIRDGIRNRPAHRALILRKPQAAPASPGPSRAGIRRAAAARLPIPGLPEPPPPPVPARN